MVRICRRGFPDQPGQVMHPAVDVGERGLEGSVGVDPSWVGHRPMQSRQVRVERFVSVVADRDDQVSFVQSTVQTCGSRVGQVKAVASRDDDGPRVNPGGGVGAG